MGEQPQCSRIFLPTKYIVNNTMKNIYESILSSAKAGKNHFLNDPDAFAKEFLKLDPERNYFIIKDVLYITSFEGKTFVIDKNFPDIKFKIGKIGGGHKQSIIIKDWEVFRKHFDTLYGSPMELGNSFSTRLSIHIQDPNFVSTDYRDIEYLLKVKGNLVIDAAKTIIWKAFPDVEGDITINAKKISVLSLPINDKTSIIKIKR